MISVWMLRINFKNFSAEDALKLKKIGIGWMSQKEVSDVFAVDENGTMSQGQSWDAVQLYKKRNDWIHNTRFWGQFVMNIKKGDYVVIPIPWGFYLMRVTGDKIKLDNERGAFTMEAEQIGDRFSRNNVNSLLQKKMRMFGSLYFVGSVPEAFSIEKENPTNDEIVAALTSPQELSEYLKEELTGKVLDSLKSPKSRLNPNSFEKLLLRLMVSLGADLDQTQIPGKYHSGKEGDVDIIANFTKINHVIHIQAKYHKEGTETGEWAIKQLLDARDKGDEKSNLNSYKEYTHAWWAVTLGTFSKSSEDLARANDIRCIDGRELARMLLDAGLAGL